MVKRVSARAEKTIRYGERILVRDGRAVPADSSLANATAPERPSWISARFKIRTGNNFMAVMDDGIGDRDIKAIANGPIMDVANIYLPAGKVSMEEFKARQRTIILDDQP